MRNAECGVWTAGREMRNAACGLLNAESRVRSVECGLRNAESGATGGNRTQHAATGWCVGTVRRFNVCCRILLEYLQSPIDIDDYSVSSRFVTTSTQTTNRERHTLRRPQATTPTDHISSTEW